MAHSVRCGSALCGSFGALSQAASEKEHRKYPNDTKTSCVPRLYESTQIGKYVQFLNACIEQKYTNHFSELRQEITGI